MQNQNKHLFSLVLVGCLSLVVFLGCNPSDNSQSSSPTFSSTKSQDSKSQAQSQRIVNQAFSLKAGEFSSYKFTIPQNSGGGTVVGNFAASGGGDDIYVVITNETGLTNIKSENNYKAYYNSGKVAADDINVNLSPGTYYIVFSNAHSMLTPKAVNADISVKY